MPLSILLASGLGIVALAFVLFPLYRFFPAKNVRNVPQSPAAVNVTQTSTGSAAKEHEQSARSALQEIELDYQLGNISEEDYNTLRERYMRRALVALKLRYHSEQDGADTVTAGDHDKELDDLIEEQLRKLKEQGTDATD